MYVEIKSISSEFLTRNFLKYLGKTKSCFNGNELNAEDNLNLKNMMWLILTVSVSNPFLFTFSSIIPLGANICCLKFLIKNLFSWDFEVYLSRLETLIKPKLNCFLNKNGKTVSSWISSHFRRNFYQFASSVNFSLQTGQQRMGSNIRSVPHF